jgi:hypothetical protein
MESELEVDGRQGLGKSLKTLMERLTEGSCTSAGCTITGAENLH